jgi:hypothetical protein
MIGAPITKKSGRCDAELVDLFAAMRAAQCLNARYCRRELMV